MARELHSRNTADTGGTGERSGGAVDQEPISSAPGMVPDPTPTWAEVRGGCLIEVPYMEVGSYVFLGEVDEVLQVDIVPVGLDVVVDEEVALVLDPVL